MRFEYKRETITYFSWLRGWEEVMNKLGAEGWEAFKIEDDSWARGREDGARTATVFLKRNLDRLENSDSPATE